MRERFEDAAAAAAMRMQHACESLGLFQQRGLGVADTDALEAEREHRQVVDRVAGHEHLFGVDLLAVDEGLERGPLVDTFRQDVEIGVGREQDLAIQFGRDAVDLLGHVTSTAEIRTPAFLRRGLALQFRKAFHGGGHGLFARPAAFDLGLQRLHGLPRMTVADRRADVANDVVRLRNGRVGQQRQHGFQTAAGDEYKLDVRVAGD